MIQLTENLWIGDAKDAENPELKNHGVNALMNVAHDLAGKRGWPEFLYAQCGLVDGPGNLPAMYHAAALMLAALIKDGRRVLVYAHRGGRPFAVAIWYLQLTHQRGWKGWIDFLRERMEVPEPNEAHRQAFEAANWNLLVSSLEDK